MSKDGTGRLTLAKSRADDILLPRVPLPTRLPQETAPRKYERSVGGAIALAQSDDTSTFRPDDAFQLQPRCWQAVAVEFVTSVDSPRPYISWLSWR